MKVSAQKVVVLGFKGNCSGRFYNRILIDLALQKKIKLIGVDFGKLENIIGIPSLKEMRQLTRKGVAFYLDLKKPKDLQKYRNLKKIDVLFVVTPDITHCKLAKEFVKKTERIFIEKPLDAILRNVRLLEIFPQTEKKVWGYDHYLAKFYPFQLKTDEWIRKGIVGKVRKIEFRLLEPEIIPSNRIGALDRGVIYDLFSHGIGVVTAVPSKWAYPDPEILRKVGIIDIKVAKYIGCKIKGASFVKADFEIPVRGKDIFCQAIMGKGVGKKPEKILKITGTKGEIFVDIEKFAFLITGRRGKIIKKGKLLENFRERFLSRAINPKSRLFETPGAMPFEAAKETLFILDESEWRRGPKGEFPRYAAGVSFLEIERIIEKRIKGKFKK